MMGAQKYLPDDLDVKEQKDAHIRRSPAVTKNDFWLNAKLLQNFVQKLFGTALASSASAASSAQEQCDQMVRLFFKIWPLATIKISPIMYQIFQSRLKRLCQIQNKLSEICQRIVKFCQSGEISPNLVTLVESLMREPVFIMHCSSTRWTLYIYMRVIHWWCPYAWSGWRIGGCHPT